GRDFRVVGVMRRRTGRMSLLDYGVPPESMANVVIPFAFADQLRPVPWISWPPAPAGAGWRTIADSASGVTEYWVRLPSEEARTRFAAALSGVGPQWKLHSAQEIARRFSKPPPPYRVFVILTLVVVLAVPTVSMFDRLIPDMPIRLAVTPTVVGIALLICLLAGLVSGIYPAWRIASVPPTRYLGKV